MPEYGKTAGGPQRGIKRSFVTALTDHTTYDAEGVGAIRIEGQKWYKWVKYDNGTANLTLAVGDVVYYLNAAGSGYVSSIVTADLSDSDNIGAGVAMSVAADGEYFWVQIRGPSYVSTALTAGADGNALTASGATDRTLDVSASAADTVVAHAIDADQKLIICNFPI